MMICYWECKSVRLCNCIVVVKCELSYSFYLLLFLNLLLISLNITFLGQHVVIAATTLNSSDNDIVHGTSTNDIPTDDVCNENSDKRQDNNEEHDEAEENSKFQKKRRQKNFCCVERFERNHSSRWY